MVILRSHHFAMVLLPYLGCLPGGITFMINPDRSRIAATYQRALSKVTTTSPPCFGIQSSTWSRGRSFFSTPTKEEAEKESLPDDDDGNKHTFKPNETSLLSQKKNYEDFTATDIDSAIQFESDDELEKITVQDTDHVYQIDSSSDLPNDNFVLTNKKQVQTDKTLNLLRSELTLKHFITTYRPASLHSKGLPLPVIMERTMDTVEDVLVHLRRIPYEKGTKTLSKEEDATRKTVVVLGSGWASHALMKVADCNKLRLIVVSPSNHFLFTPMLAGAAVGTVEYSSMTEAVRAANPLIDEYIEGSATSVDLPSQTVTVKLSSLLQNLREGDSPTITLSYDHLVVAVGCRVDYKGVTGAKTHALRLKSCDDARKLRQNIGECFEYASRGDVFDKLEERRERVTFLIVGGGPTGVELAGEIYDLAEDITRKHKGVYPKLNGMVRVVLVHSGPDLVPQFEDNLRAEATKSLRKKGVEVILNTRVTEVGDGFAKLSTKVIDPATGHVTAWKDTTMKLGLTVWCAGTAPAPFVSELLKQLPKEAQHGDGKIRVDRWMRPQVCNGTKLGSVIVMGDAAAFPEENYSSTLPQTAQVAGQQGAFAARMFDRGYDLTMTPPVLPQNGPDARESNMTSFLSKDNANVFYDPVMNEWLNVRGLIVAPPFQFLNLGMLAYLGGGEALSQIQLGDVPVGSYFGSVAFLLWRSVYLVKQVATRNRILVTFDW
eukprot:CAMPEP_0172517962 /NCGR_PEP_ID=MMETSP1066-20121228/289305_1 /TAXON_ID=671091 /ORGANISM="Coscinodiscus wailesii, Strain CCMP2513" /LENGTH=716 /DNA_ID=CAMNT_0013300205 /DNA_START=198 /DNA_END=2345 /DNA_ORIENTATION=+